MLPSTFDDIKTPDGDVILEQNEQGMVAVPADIVEGWLTLTEPTGKVAEYLDRWRSEGRI